MTNLNSFSLWEKARMRGNIRLLHYYSLTPALSHRERGLTA